jgi:4-oxalocrotonate tautomerase
MPILTVKIIEGRDQATKRLLVQRLSQVIMDTLGSPPEKVRVLIEDMPKGNYAIGGVLIADSETS